MHAAMEKTLAKQEAEFEKMLAKYDVMASQMEATRTIGREAIYRVVVLSAVIVGFSTTLLSIEDLNFTVRTELLRAGWIMFAIVVVLGPFMVFLESRAQYAITWRSAQAQDFERREPTRREQAQVFGLVLYTVLVRPRNLIFVRDTRLRRHAKGVAELARDPEASRGLGPGAGN
jgi:hypothetical protein